MVVGLTLGTGKAPMMLLPWNEDTIRSLTPHHLTAEEPDHPSLLRSRA
jgi:hypothetical protein